MPAPLNAYRFRELVSRLANRRGPGEPMQILDDLFPTAALYSDEDPVVAPYRGERNWQMGGQILTVAGQVAVFQLFNPGQTWLTAVREVIISSSVAGLASFLITNAAVGAPAGGITLTDTRYGAANTPPGNAVGFSMVSAPTVIDVGPTVSLTAGQPVSIRGPWVLCGTDGPFAPTLFNLRIIVAAAVSQCCLAAFGYSRAAETTELVALP